MSRTVVLCTVVLLALAVGAGTTSVLAIDRDGPVRTLGDRATGHEGRIRTVADRLPSGDDLGQVDAIIPFDEVEIFFEENTTDEDLGIQLFLDGEGWQRVMVIAPNHRRLVDVRVGGNARVIGLTELFSESAEPEYSELPRDEFLALFQPGVYRIVGVSVEGDVLLSFATLTHNIPEGPEILYPEEEEDTEVDPEEDFTVEWELVESPGPGSEIVAYQVIIEKDEDDERLRVVEADMLPTDTSFTLAPGFLEPGKDYKVEVIAVESSGNKAITEVEFETEDDD